MGKKEVRDLEDTLAAVAGMLPMPDGEDKLHFHSEGYPGLLWFYEKAKADIAKLGMTEAVEHAIRECMVLVKQGEREAARDLLFAACGELREKSGTFAEMRKMYEAPTRH
ncbi:MULTISPECIES: hypothetical protein [unclassified Roseateles]|uniref:hypothetical protein n=1 Tax=unclassified Roseateles TaxID=2626991 RepID=UPI0007002208|nr:MULTISPECIES: hypothetical protein [unclassified Roseateles]KQW51478.1 hypothetical protein ASC81_02220 [Pelomonas sp. Root405]KRA77711.1 hypothetical protein ASD88_02220 [Pelomonas sp. Root662]